ncbi:hypothetical protein SAMN05421837_104789 [Amycolatopsis pretoriensis]|uniref:Uncharacterized protein n=1 Tax=Amycolatopsis pretoriensis TaxID=218821 RepID=A0A1H5QU44_9PSEU|nr:hypothetical protein [Amycolatopsis pretoriensis]SEF29640.1 hypothetical protein SAMN05421837_104789 [Amycolatopsis pretoriensis]
MTDDEAPPPAAEGEEPVVAAVDSEAGDGETVIEDAEPVELGLGDPPPQTSEVVRVLVPEPPAVPVTLALPPTLGRADEVKQLEREHDQVMLTREYNHETQLQKEELRHRSQMQRLVLGSIMVVLLLVFGLVLAAVWNHGITPEFGLELSRLIVPSLVGSAATIVGAMFISGGSGIKK